MEHESKITLGIAEDHPIFRKGLINCLCEDSFLDVRIEANNGSVLLEKLSLFQPEIILMDVAMPIIDGIESLKIIQSKYPSIKIIMISSYYEIEMIYEAITFGARGFLPKHADIEIIIDAIKQIKTQGYYFDDIVSPEVLKHLEKNGIVYPQYEKSVLSNREIEILNLICKGLSNNEMAKSLFRSVRTIENHRQNILSKTKTKNLADLIVYAIKNGYFKIEA